jgi:hypothetical protein
MEDRTGEKRNPTFREALERAGTSVNRPQKGTTEQDSASLVIGEDIPWESIENQFCRVSHFTPLATVQSGKVKNVPTVPLPYGLLQVDLPKVTSFDLPERAILPISHKLDFLNLWRAIRDRGVSAEEEVLVVYYPKRTSGLGRLLAGGLPKLIIQIYPKGTLEKIEALIRSHLRSGETIPDPIAEWDPREDNRFLR